MTQSAESETFARRGNPWALIAVGVLVMVPIVLAVVREARQPAPLPYSTFLDEVEAGNVASVTFEGAQVTVDFKHPLAASGSGRQEQAITLVPSVGDPSLIPELRKQRVEITVAAQSWTSMLERIPWPIWLFGGALLLAALRKLFRRGDAQAASEAPERSTPVHPMQGIIGLAAGLLDKGAQGGRGRPPKA